jgi:Flp pilus assembly protein TadD
VRLDLGRAQLQSGQVDAALATLTPAAPGPMRAALLGAAHASRRAWPQAVEHYRAALHAQPDDVLLLNGLAWALRQQGAADESRRLFERSLALAPNQPEIRALLERP